MSFIKYLVLRETSNTLDLGNIVFSHTISSSYSYSNSNGTTFSCTNSQVSFSQRFFDKYEFSTSFSNDSSGMVSFGIVTGNTTNSLSAGFHYDDKKNKMFRVLSWDVATQGSKYYGVVNSYSMEIAEDTLKTARNVGFGVSCVVAYAAAVYAYPPTAVIGPPVFNGLAKVLA